MFKGYASRIGQCSCKNLCRTDTRRSSYAADKLAGLTPREKALLNSSSGHGPNCNCHKSWLSLCSLIPQQTFGNSYFTAPSVVFLRLFFQAKSFRLNCKHSNRGPRPNKKEPGELTAGARFSEQVLKPRRLARERSRPSPFSHLNRKVSVDAFLQEVQGSPDKYGTYKVVSVSWVKALASHMSHEFIQFVIEDTRNRRRLRLITDRQETGDWVITTESGIEAASKFSWPSLSPYKDRHNLPLPLVSTTIDEASRPSLLQMAEMMHGISTAAPSYSPMREHCWWYAEAIFEAVRSRYTITNLREWPWARYRYSFVLHNSWVQRRTLAADAHEFEKMCMNDMTY